MNSRIFRTSFVLIFLSFWGLIALSSCGGSTSQNHVPDTSIKSSAAVSLNGQIRDEDGFFESGQLIASDAHEKPVSKVEWQDEHGKFSIEIPAGTAFPVVLTAKAKHEGGKLKTLVAAVIGPTLTNHDITPNSTLVAEKAKALGGYTKKNMMQASLDTVNRPQGDRSVGGFRGDPTKQFGGWH